MPVPPQRRPAYEGKVRRNANFVLTKIKAVTCPQCKTLIRPHQACPVCGKYKGRDVLNLKIDKKTAKKMNKKAESKKEKEEKKSADKK